MHANHTKAFQISAELTAPTAKEERVSSLWLGQMGCCSSSPGIHSTGNTCPERFLGNDSFLVELLSPQTCPHPSCTAPCRTRAGASLCLAAMSQQAQELPGSLHFSGDF